MPRARLRPPRAPWLVSPGPEGQRGHQGALGAQLQLSLGPEHGIASTSDTFPPWDRCFDVSGSSFGPFGAENRAPKISLKYPTLSLVFSQFLDMFGRDTRYPQIN